MTATVDAEELEAKVKDLYRDVAQQPQGAFHFELGEPVALRVGYDADLWASCIGGAAQQELYLAAIESSGFVVDRLRVNVYEFISEQARNASAKYGVKSISVLAIRNS